MRKALKERRAARRCPFFLPVELVHANGVLAPAPLAVDISAGGIKLRAMRPVALSEVRLFIPLPRGIGSKTHLFTRGRLVWRTLTAAGFAFFELQAETRASLESLTASIAGSDRS